MIFSTKGTNCATRPQMRQQNDRNSKHETKSCFQVLILGATHPYLCHNWNSKHNVLGVNSWGANPVPCLHPQGGGYPLQKGDTFLLPVWFPAAKVQQQKETISNLNICQDQKAGGRMIYKGCKLNNRSMHNFRCCSNFFKKILLIIFKILPIVFKILLIIFFCKTLALPC